MTATSTVPAGPAAGPPAPARAALACGRRRGAAVTLLIRLALHARSFDLFGDEVIYTDLGRSVISGRVPPVRRGPFFLHGPALLLPRGGLGTARRPAGRRDGADRPDARAERAAGRGHRGGPGAAGGPGRSLAGGRWSAGLLFALDPFCIRQNDRVLLETAMMLWVLLGYLVFTPLIGRLPSRRGLAPRGRRRPAVRLRRADQGRGGPAHRAPAARRGRAPVGAPPALTPAHRRAPPCARLRRLRGRRRRQRAVQQLVGGQDSGHPADAGADPDHRFPQPRGGTSLSPPRLAEAGFFGTTYAVLALAVPRWCCWCCAAAASCTGCSALLYCAAAVTLGYAVSLGTLEEQELYLLVVPSLLIIPVAVTLLRDGAGARSGYPAEGRLRSPRAVLLTVALAMLTSLNLTTCGQWLRQPDDGFARLTQFMSARVPAGRPRRDYGC